MAAVHPEFKQAGSNLARSAKTITALIENCLLPIAAVNYAFERGKQYFERDFKNDLEMVTSKIPAEMIVEPKASIAAPILQGLTFSHEEPELKSLFLNLLKSTMDSRTAGQTHPAFVDVIRQVNSEEARLIVAILASADTLPILNLRIAIEKGAGGHILLKGNVMGTFDAKSKLPIVLPRMGSMVDNWSRLGLITVNYGEKLMDDAQYAWAETWPEYIEAVQANPGKEVEFQKGVLRVTNFGREFFRAVV